MVTEHLGNKLPGKTQFSGRRRTTTRTSGFSSHEDSTGGEYKIEDQDTYLLKKDECLSLIFTIPDHTPEDLVAFGGWYFSDHALEVDIALGGFTKKTLTSWKEGNWAKFGSMGFSSTHENVPWTKISFKALEDTKISLYDVNCGIVSHKHIDAAKTNPDKKHLLNNMYQFAPEANFYVTEGDVSFILNDEKDLELEHINSPTPIHLKSCNRCARFLPININDERYHLSFSSHCVANAPCTHTGFGKLKNIDTSSFLQLHNGFQLECRYCKKFEVNAPHNPQRTADQMKEDGTRRRHFELLLTHLFKGSPQINYRKENPGKELTTDIWEKFGKKCFKCQIDIPTSKHMNLDHTRPLALLWPLDKTATCLCKACNSAKSDKPPIEFYSEDEIQKLSTLTGISVEDLKDPSPNLSAISKIIADLDWLMLTFCQRPELAKERDGKLTSELFLKALQKTFNRSDLGKNYDLLKIYEQKNSLP